MQAVDKSRRSDSLEFMKVDTLSIAQRLQAVGASKALAEEQAQIMREVVEAQLVTKADLAEAVAQLRTEMFRMALATIGTLTVIIALFEFLAR